jgi:hypothetical protein
MATCDKNDTMQDIQPEMIPIPDRGDFSFIAEQFTRQMYEDAWETVHSQPKYIEYCINKSNETPWLFIEDETANEIMKNLKLVNQHSGCSVAILMRNIEVILKYGWDEWVRTTKHDM